MNFIMNKILFVLFICLLCFFNLSAQSVSINYQFKGVDDEYANDFAKDIISDAIRQSRLQVDDTLCFVLTYEQKTLTLSYLAKGSNVSGYMSQENADLYSDLESVIRKAVAKSLEDLEVATKPKEVIKPVESEVTANENVAPQKEIVLSKAEITPPVVNNGSASTSSNNVEMISQNKTKDKGAIWQNIRNFIMAPRNKSDKIVLLKTSGKLSTFTTLKSGLTAELTDEGILKIKGSGRMLTEDETLLKSLRSYVIAIEVEEGVTDVSGFQYFASVEYVLLPSTLYRIAPYAFKDCVKLLSINIPESTVEIGTSAFQNCEALSTLSLPQGLSNIGDKAFLGCRKLQSINLPSSISVIAEALFRNCLSLESIEIPLSVQHIKENAFKNCRSITKLYLPDNVINIEKGCFQDMKMLAEVRLSERLVSIPSGAFESCSSLSSVVVPQNVQMVSNYAFKDCENLVQITFMCQNMMSLGESCFEDCKRLCSIYLHSQYPPACSDLFDDKNIKARVVIMVPNSSVSFYKAADYWKTLSIRSM